jgi:hypothetical protein
MNVNKILQRVLQTVLFVAFVGFMIGSLALMSIVYTVLPNYQVEGKPVAIVIGPLVNAQAAIVFFILALLWLGLFYLVRTRWKG